MNAKNNMCISITINLIKNYNYCNTVINKLIFYIKSTVKSHAPLLSMKAFNKKHMLLDVAMSEMYEFFILKIAKHARRNHETQKEHQYDIHFEKAKSIYMAYLCLI